MGTQASWEERVNHCLRRFLTQSGRDKVEFNRNTDLISDVGLTSDEGVDFVLDLCDEFDFEFPKDFNPFVHEDGRRGRRFGELVKVVQMLAPVEEAA